MPIFYVHQKDTYSEERGGGFVWSPQRTIIGGINIGYSNMNLIHRGDFILHHSNKEIRAIGRAKNDCYQAIKPKNLIGEWNSQGYRVDVDYYDLDRPINVLDYQRELSSIRNYGRGNAFTYDGRPTQFYMCTLTYEQAFFLLNRILSKQTREVTKAVLNEALAVVREDYGFEDDFKSIDEVLSIDTILEFVSHKSPSRKGEKKQKELVNSPSTGREVPKRDPYVAGNALCLASHKCEVNPKHQTFKRKNTEIPYMESHHLIPISKFRDFEYSLDVEENVVSLCPNCHRLLHHGMMSEKEPILRSLLQQRFAGLRQCGISITLDKLKEYYL